MTPPPTYRYGRLRPLKKPIKKLRLVLQLDSQSATQSLCQRLRSEPRLHSTTMERQCSACGKLGLKTVFSKKQWKAGDARRCKECTSSGRRSSPTTNWIDPRDLHDAVTRGEHIEDRANSTVSYRYGGVMYVTAADDHTTPISAHAESAPAKAAEDLARTVRAAYTTPCEGQLDFDEWQDSTGRYDEYPNWFAWETAALRPSGGFGGGFGGDFGGDFGGGFSGGFNSGFGADGYYDDYDDYAADHGEPIHLDDEMYRRLLRRRAGDRSQYISTTRCIEGFEYMRHADQRVMRAAVEAEVFGQEAVLRELVGKISQLDMLEGKAYCNVQGLRDQLENYGLREWRVRERCFPVTPRLTTADIRGSFAQRELAERQAQQQQREAEANAKKEEQEAELVRSMRKAGGAPPAGGAEWVKGCCATIHGLQRRQDLNGLFVEILAWDGSKQRWAVSVVATGERAAAKPANLLLAPDDWPLCSETVPETRRRETLLKLVRKLAGDTSKAWRDGTPESVLWQSVSSYTEQTPLEDWQPPATLDEQRKLAHDIAVYGERGDWLDGRWGGSVFQGRCVSAGPPLVEDLIALDNIAVNYHIKNVLQILLAMRGVQPEYPCGYALFADPLIVKCARRGDFRDRQMIRALVAEGENVDTCLRWEEVQEKMGGYTKEWQWNGDSALMAAAKKGNLAALKTLLRLGATNSHKCCYADDLYDDSASAAAKRKNQQAAAELIESYNPGEVPSLFQLAAQQVGAEALTTLPEVVQASVLACV